VSGRRSATTLNRFSATAGAATADHSEGRADSRLARVVHAPAAWLVLLVGLSTAIRGAIAIRVPSPWILPDEVVYSELAKSIAAGHRPAVRGVPVFGWGEVYPTLIAPAWALIDDTMHAYHAALAISALVMSLAAVPAYLLACLFVSRRASFLVAVATVLVPSMGYTGVVMTENAAYPVFLLAVYLIARAVRRPSAMNQLLAVAGLVVMAFTRIQGLALVGAFLCGVLIYGLLGPAGERAAYLRRFVPTGVFLVVGSVAPTVVSTLAGDGPSGWLGSRSSTFAGFHAREIPEWVAYLAADLVLYVAAIPVAASIVVIARGLTRHASQQARLFAATAFPTFVAVLTSVSLVSASLDVDGTENLNERYAFYVVPLLFVGFALWVQEGLPRRRPSATAVVAACCILVVALPIDRLEYNAGFQSVALLPWLGFSLSRVALALLVLAFVAACGALLLLCRSDGVGRLWLVVCVWMVLTGVTAMVSNANSAENSAYAFDKVSASWIDDAVPAGSRVVGLWDQRTAKHESLDGFYSWLMVTEFFNRTLSDIYRLGPRTYYEAFLPTVPARLMSDGKLADARGRALEARYVLATCRWPVEGSVVARAPRGALLLFRVDGPVRLSKPSWCRRAEP
jgi:hypothetical protein